MNKDNFSLDELLRLAKASQSQKPEDMLGAVQSRIPENKMDEIKKVLGDKKALEEILNSEQAKRIMKQFGKK
ncbi:MAG: hypothetical protein J6B52_00735 [Clostridia bacterium]|nr:hypothetical protein [Clostridia bacterium]